MRTPDEIRRVIQAIENTLENLSTADYVNLYGNANALHWALEDLPLSRQKG